MVHHPTHQQLLNTKTEAGRMLETWLKLGMLMVQSPLDLPQWLLLDIQMVEDRKCLSERNDTIILIFSERIRNCGNSTLSKAKSSMRHYQEITPSVWACFLLIKTTAARIRRPKFYNNLAQGILVTELFIQINIDSQKIVFISKISIGLQSGLCELSKFAFFNPFSYQLLSHISSYNQSKRHQDK